MWLPFFLENAHFASNIFAALVMFATAWLYLDSWVVNRPKIEIPRLLGLLLLSASFVVEAVFIEMSLFASSVLGESVHGVLLLALRLPGYALIILTLLLDPLPQKPAMAGYTQARPNTGAKSRRPRTPRGNQAFFGLSLPTIAPLLPYVRLLLPVGAWTIALLYWRRGTTGLERHLKPVAVAFAVFGLYELTALARLLRTSSVVSVYTAVAPFGPAWILEHVLLVLASVLLGLWVWKYLLKRLQTQLFMIFTVTILSIFLVTTVTFTALLLKNIQDATLSQLETDAKVLRLALTNKQEEVLSDAEALANNGQVGELVAAPDYSALSGIAQTHLLSKQQSFLVITDQDGRVVVRGENPDRTGDSLSDDPFVQRALAGEAVSGVARHAGVLAPELSVRGAAPIVREGAVIGSVLTGARIDNTFVDGVKSATGLATAVYGGNTLSATTLVAADGKSRHIGTVEEDAEVQRIVLQEGRGLTKAINLINVPYFAAYLPLTGPDDTILGMLFVGTPQIAILQAAGHSIELTFLVTAILIVLSIIPAILIARYIAYQVQ